jgi:hypothetical protein
MSAQLLIVDGDPRVTAPDSRRRKVIDSWPRGMRWFAVASQLWRLVDPKRADRIDAILADVDQRSEAYGEARYESADMIALVNLFRGLSDALFAAGIIDKKLLIQPQQAEYLATQVPDLEFQGRSAQDLASVLAEGVVNVEGLRNFLQSALDQDAYVVTSY